MREMLAVRGLALVEKWRSTDTMPASGRRRRGIDFNSCKLQRRARCHRCSFPTFCTSIPWEKAGNSPQRGSRWVAGNCSLSRLATRAAHRGLRDADGWMDEWRCCYGMQLTIVLRGRALTRHPAIPGWPVLFRCLSAKVMLGGAFTS